MRGRSKVGSVKSRRRKPAARKRFGRTKAAWPRSSSAAGQEPELAQLIRERDEAREQLSATSDVLKVISSSPGESQPVFDAILKNATRICEANFGVLNIRENEAFRIVAMHNPPSALRDANGAGRRDQAGRTDRGLC